MKFRNLVAIGLALAWGGSAHAAFFVVNSAADVPDAAPGNGVCDPVNAVGNTCTLRAAIMEANALAGPDTIGLASGNYELSIAGIDEDLAATGDLDITEEVTITNATSNPPVVSGEGQDRVFDVHDGGNLTLTNIWVTAGVANAPGNTRGGAIQINGGGEVALERTVLAFNLANLGGAIYNDGVLTVNESILVGNAIVDEQVLNSFANGDAILNRGSLSMSNSTVMFNGPLESPSELLANQAAIHSRQGFFENPGMLIVNSTIWNNQVGIRSEGVNLLSLHNTIVGNEGIGLRFVKNLDNLGQVQASIGGTVIANNGADCNGIPSADDEFSVINNVNASSDDTCGFVGVLDQQSVELAFIEPEELDAASPPVLIPSPNSTLIDRVTNCIVNSDQRGRDRPLDGNGDLLSFCDIGAVEYDSATDRFESLFSESFEQ